MEIIIKVYDMIGSEGLSRTNVSKLHLDDIRPNVSVELDMKGVNFLSRSFTDEIISQLDKRKYTIVNANSIITNMFHAVKEGRKHPRIHKDNGAVIKRFDTMAALSQYLNSSLV